MMNVLVTGGCGFLGRHVVARLSANRLIHNIVVADNFDPLCGGVDSPGARKVEVRGYRQIYKVAEEHAITHIVHLAAYGRNLTCQDHPEMAWQVNVGGTRNVLSLASERNLRAICCSSNIVLSDQNTVYKQTKKSCEELISSLGNGGVNCMGLRPSNIYGAGQSKTEYQLCAFAGLDKSFSETGKFKISGDGTQTRDWVHAVDVARAFEAALFITTTGVTLDVCTGIQASMNEVAALLKVPVEYAEPRPGDAKQLISDPDPAWFAMAFKAELKLEHNIHDAFPSVPR